ncbi:MAG TPA: hypothetical protein VE173_13580 [Longimicrobiales bacterium]|nr:hypothetical protein [Longimicrobiales bacterium]
MEAELEYCREHPNLSGEDPVVLGTTVLAHLRKDPGYYHRLLEQAED